MTESEQPNTKQPHHPHDKGYKQLLTNKKTFLELLKTFVQCAGRLLEEQKPFFQ